MNTARFQQKTQSPCAGELANILCGSLRLFFLASILCLLSVAPLFGQATSTSVKGVIADPGGAVLPGVTVTALNTDTTLKQTTVTSSSGLYSLAPLPPGNYRIRQRSRISRPIPR